LGGLAGWFPGPFRNARRCIRSKCRDICKDGGLLKYRREKGNKTIKDLCRNKHIDVNDVLGMYVFIFFFFIYVAAGLCMCVNSQSQLLIVLLIALQLESSTKYGLKMMKKD
jgi:hypothetical protein